MYRLPGILILIFSVFVVSSFGQQQTTEAAFQSLINEQNIVGLAVVAVKDGKIVYKHNFGMQ
ncbi:MAG: hypothetical protein QM762_11380, partial [Chryseolinea sp.]